MYVFELCLFNLSALLLLQGFQNLVGVLLLKNLQGQIDLAGLLPRLNSVIVFAQHLTIIC